MHPSIPPSAPANSGLFPMPNSGVGVPGAGMGFTTPSPSGIPNNNTLSYGYYPGGPQPPPSYPQPPMYNQHQHQQGFITPTNPPPYPSPTTAHLTYPMPPPYPGGHPTGHGQVHVHSVPQPQPPPYYPYHHQVTPSVSPACPPTYPPQPPHNPTNYGYH